jgi:hypothetical protein
MSPKFISKEEPIGGVHLEPRVAKLELGMERLTDDLRDLAQVVRTQGTQIEQDIQKLVIAVTQASGPRKTDWSTIIAAAMLVLTIAGAAFWPLNQQVQELKNQQQLYHDSMIDHQKLDNHPVGTALVQRLEDQLKIHQQINEKEVANLVIQASRDHDSLQSQFRQELAFTERNLAGQVSAINSAIDLYTDKIHDRLLRLEATTEYNITADLDELRQWRLKAMNGDTKSGGVSNVTNTREQYTPNAVLSPKSQSFTRKKK